VQSFSFCTPIAAVLPIWASIARSYKPWSSRGTLCTKSLANYSA